MSALLLDSRCRNNPHFLPVAKLLSWPFTVGFPGGRGAPVDPQQPQRRAPQAGRHPLDLSAHAVLGGGEERKSYVCVREKHHGLLTDCDTMCLSQDSVRGSSKSSSSMKLKIIPKVKKEREKLHKQKSNSSLSGIRLGQGSNCVFIILSKSLRKTKQL